MAEINFFWDPLSDNILQERDETGTVTAEYTTEPGLYGNLISQDRQGEERQFHFDAIGSTRALSDEIEQVTDTCAYTAFGESTERTGETVTPFQYIGQKGYYRDELAGEHSVRRRWLIAKHGRWASVDPVGLDGIGSDLYAYVLNNPMSRIDPSGLISVTPVCEDKMTQLGIKDCGQIAEARWIFRLERATHCPGFIVQHVHFKCKVSPCEDCPIGADTKFNEIDYLEAWFVAEDQPFDEGHQNRKWTDHAFNKAIDGHCGVIESVGETKFFCMDPDHPDAKGVGTGDLRKSWTKGPRYLSGNCEIGTGELPGFPDPKKPAEGPPKWWSDAGLETAGVTKFKLNYTCCTCKPPLKVEASASPDPRDKNCQKITP